MLRYQIVLCLTCAFTALQAQTDPGPRPGPANAGRPLPGLTPSENAQFQEGARRFQQMVSVSGTEPSARDQGLGPRFNATSCAACHAQPAVGGSSPARNPQVAIAVEYGARNIVPAFLKPDGPVLVTRFINNSDGTADGGAHALFVISGRADAGTCAIQQPDFATAMAQGNVAFRIPTPLFGAGLIEAIPDAAILRNMAANSGAKAAFGIAGHENRNSNDGTISRFGWKAQDKSLETFAAEAYNVEIGVTNELFPTERDETPGCDLNPLPEDRTDFGANSPIAAMSDVTAFAAFMRWLAPLNPVPPQGPPGGPGPQVNPSVVRGQQAFTEVGCALCHTPSMMTGSSSSPSLNRKPVPLYSDLLVHHIGDALADGIQQGLAAGDEFRTAPLWGLGQRIYLLHDGRTTDLMQAIQAHASRGSEANRVVAAFNGLPAETVQDVMNFLREQ